MDLLSIFPTENRHEIDSIASDFNLDPERFERMLAFATGEPNSFLHVSKAEIDLLGPNAAMAGKNEQDQEIDFIVGIMLLYLVIQLHN